MNTVQITLNEKNFNMKMDMATIANTQAMLKKQGIKVPFSEIFEAIGEQDLTVLNALVVCAIQRCHPQITEARILELLTFNEIENIFKSTAELVELSMPSAENTGVVKKK